MISSWWKRKTATPEQPAQKPAQEPKKIASANVTTEVRVGDDTSIKFTESGVHVFQLGRYMHGSVSLSLDDVDELFRWLSTASSEAESLRIARGAALAALEKQA